MKIVACYKLVPEEQDIQVNSDKSLNLSRAEWKIGQYDLNAVEAGMELAASCGGTVTALTAGGSIVENSKLKKGILSRGPQELYAVMDDKLDKADSYCTASVLASSVKKIGAVDLVLCGEGSGDIYAQQVGPVLGGLLGWASVNAVSKVTVNGDKLLVERSLENEIEVLEVELPAVLSVTTDINKPRIPGMKEIMAAGKKLSTIWNLTDGNSDCSNKAENLSTLAPDQAERKQIIIEGDGEEQINELYQYLRMLI